MKKILLVFVCAATLLLTSCMTAKKMTNRAGSLTVGDSPQTVEQVMGRKPNRVQQIGEYKAWQYRAGEAVKDLFCVIWFKDDGFYKTTFYSGFMSFRTLELSDLEE